MLIFFLGLLLVPHFIILSLELKQIFVPGNQNSIVDLKTTLSWNSLYLPLSFISPPSMTRIVSE